MSSLTKIFDYLRNKGIAEKFNEDQPRGDNGRWSAGGFGGQDFNHEMVRKVVSEEGRAAGLRHGSDIMNQHHQGGGEYHPDVHAKLKEEIDKAAGSKAFWMPLESERQQGFVRGLREAHDNLKSHEKAKTK